MRIELSCKNYKESQKLSELLDKKLSRLEKYFTKEAFAKVKLTGVKNDKFTMEISIAQPGLPVPVRAEITTNNMYDNIDKLMPKLERQIIKFRTRMEDRKKDPRAYIIPDVPAEVLAPADLKTEFGKVVKVKNFAISIITVEQAVAELELLDHNFYVFVNADNNKVSVLYKRNDGDYGLITPEY